MENSISDFLTREHRHCDESLAAAERAVIGQDWSGADQHFREFSEATRIHLSMEEDVLFPEFEKVTGNTHGPTWVMRGEHREIRGMLDDLADALRRSDKPAFLGYADTIHILLQQHNMKEENILYPMAEQVLAEVRDEVMKAMTRLDALA